LALPLLKATASRWILELSATRKLPGLLAQRINS
jgi:hypothetical protein